MNKKNIIIVADDDDNFRKTVSRNLRLNKNFQIDVLEAKIGQEVFEIVTKNHNIDLILLDYNFEKWGGAGALNGLEIADKLLGLAPEIPIVMTSEVGDRGDIAMKASKKYLLDFLDKPFDNSKLYAKIEKYLKHKSNFNQIDISEIVEFLQNIGFYIKGKNMLEICEQIKIALTNNKNILIVGETGTGKTTLAEAIHKLSNRRDKEFVKINCAQIQPNIFESEIFGHRRGSFTGAIENKEGVLEKFIGTTFFLDQITEMSIDLQAKLLYTIGEEATYAIVGDIGKPKKVDAVFIGATKFDPNEAIKNGLLLKDLKSRLCHTIIRLPTLKERQEDLQFLIKKIIAENNDYYKTEIGVEDDALVLLCRQPWEENVRQLKSVISRLVTRTLLVKKSKIEINDVEIELRNEYGFNNLNSELTLDDQLLSLVKSLIENKEKLIPESTKKLGSGGIKDLISIVEEKLIKEIIKQEPKNISAAARFVYENKDTLKNKIIKFKL